MASNKLTNYQLNIIVGKIWQELYKEIDENNKRIVKDFNINSNKEAVEALTVLNTIRRNEEKIKVLNDENNSLKIKARKLLGFNKWAGISSFSNIEEIKQYIKEVFTKDSLTYLSKSDIELEVLTNQNSDISSLINTIIEKFKKKLTN